MTKNPESDTKVLSLPTAQPETPRLDIQSAANWLAGYARLNEINAVKQPTSEQYAEKQRIHGELSVFIGAHAPNLVHAFLQVASILHPLQQSLSSIIVPCVAKALAERFDTAKACESEKV